MNRPTVFFNATKITLWLVVGDPWLLQVTLLARSAGSLEGCYFAGDSISGFDVPGACASPSRKDKHAFAVASTVPRLPQLRL